MRIGNQRITADDVAYLRAMNVHIGNDDVECPPEMLAPVAAIPEREVRYLLHLEVYDGTATLPYVELQRLVDEAQSMQDMAQRMRDTSQNWCMTAGEEHRKADAWRAAFFAALPVIAVLAWFLVRGA